MFLPEVHRLQTNRAVPHALEPALRSSLPGTRGTRKAAASPGRKVAAEGRAQRRLLEHGPGGAEKSGSGWHCFP